MVSPYEEDYIVEEEQEEGGYAYSGETYGTGIPSGPGSAKYQLAVIKNLRDAQKQRTQTALSAGASIAVGGAKIGYDEYRSAKKEIQVNPEADNWLTRWRTKRQFYPKEVLVDKMTPTNMEVKDTSAMDTIMNTYKEMIAEDKIETIPPRDIKMKPRKDFSQKLIDQEIRNEQALTAERLAKEFNDPYAARLKADGTYETGTEISIRLQKEKIAKLDAGGAHGEYMKNRSYHQLSQDTLDLARMDNEMTTHSSSGIFDDVLGDNYKPWNPTVAEYIELPDGSRVPRNIEYVPPKEIPASSGSGAGSGGSGGGSGGSSGGGY